MSNFSDDFGLLRRFVIRKPLWPRKGIPAIPARVSGSGRFWILRRQNPTHLDRGVIEPVRPFVTIRGRRCVGVRVWKAVCSMALGKVDEGAWRGEVMPPSLKRDAERWYQVNL